MKKYLTVLSLFLSFNINAQTIDGVILIQTKMKFWQANGFIYVSGEVNNSSNFWQSVKLELTYFNAQKQAIIVDNQIARNAINDTKQYFQTDILAIPPHSIVPFIHRRDMNNIIGSVHTAVVALAKTFRWEADGKSEITKLELLPLYTDGDWAGSYEVKGVFSNIDKVACSTPEVYIYGYDNNGMVIADAFAMAGEPAVEAGSYKVFHTKISDPMDSNGKAVYRIKSVKAISSCGNYH